MQYRNFVIWANIVVPSYLSYVHLHEINILVENIFRAPRATKLNVVFKVHSIVVGRLQGALTAKIIILFTKYIYMLAYCVKIEWRDGRIPVYERRASRLTMIMLNHCLVT